ncbi:transposase [bacterium]|nr:MAG: transposase [bacterium]
MDEDNVKRGWYKSRGLPHRDDLGLIQSVTYRLEDSFPQSLIASLGTLSEAERSEPKARKLIERALDEGHGECWLSQPMVAQLVSDSFRHLDLTGSPVYAYVVMPNHVHLLFQPSTVRPLGDLMRNSKRFTGREANKVLGRTGSFWAEDYFDRFIRDEEHFWNCVSYIHQNPVKAGLCERAEEWRWSSAYVPNFG